MNLILKPVIATCILSFAALAWGEPNLEEGSAIERLATFADHVKTYEPLEIDYAWQFKDMAVTASQLQDFKQEAIDAGIDLCRDYANVATKTVVEDFKDFYAYFVDPADDLGIEADYILSEAATKGLNRDLAVVLGDDQWQSCHRSTRAYGVSNWSWYTNGTLTLAWYTGAPD